MSTEKSPSIKNFTPSYKKVRESINLMHGVLDASLDGSEVTKERKMYLELVLERQVRTLMGIEAFKEKSDLTYDSILTAAYEKELAFEVEKGTAKARKGSKTLQFIAKDDERLFELREKYGDNKGEIEFFYDLEGKEEDDFVQLYHEKAEDDAKKRVIDQLFGELATITRELVQTPHPTESLTREAIEAEKDMNLYLANEARFIALGQKPQNAEQQEIYETLQKKIKAFSDAVSTPTESMTIGKEMARSNKQSEHLYDAVMIEVQRVIKAVEKLDPGYFKEGKVPLKTLAKFSNLFRSWTWSPGDADSKPHFNPVEMREGIIKVESAMERKYLEELANICTKTDSQEVIDQAYKMMWRRMDSLRDIYLENGYQGVNNVGEADDIAYRKLVKIVEDLRAQGKEDIASHMENVLKDWKKTQSYRLEIRGSYDKIYENEIRIAEISNEIEILKAKLSSGRGDKGEIEKEISSLKIEKADLEEFNLDHKKYIEKVEKRSQNKLGNGSYNGLYSEVIQIPGYISNQEFLNDVEDLKDLGDKHGIAKYVDEEGNELPFSYIDGLHVGGSNFGERSQAGQLRQSSEFFDMALKEVFLTLKTKGIEVKDSADLLRILSTDKEAASEIRKVIYKDLEAIRDKANGLWASADANETDLDNKDKPLAYYSRTLEMLGIAAKNPGSYPVVHIAECNSSDIILGVQALIKLMTPPEQKAINDRFGTVSVRPLFEYPEHIEKMAEMMFEAFENEHFRAAQEEIVSHKSPIQIYKPEHQEITRDGENYIAKTVPAELRDMTVMDLLRNMDERAVPSIVADMKERHGADWKNIIRKKTVTEYVVMVAGSDSFKSASSSIITMVDNGYDETRARLAVFGVIVGKYIGTGSAFHRNSVNDALIRTRQGLEMRESGEQVAMQNERLKSMRLQQRFNLDLAVDELDDAGNIVNFGNYLNLKKEDARTLDDLIARSKHRVKQYGESYSSKSFETFVDNVLPSGLEKGYSFAARPPYRVGGGATSGPETMRAIGFGQSLNNAEWGAVHLYYHLTEFLGADPQEAGFAEVADAKKAAKLFRESPKMQDIMNRAAFNLALSDAEQGWEFTKVGINNMHVKRVDSNAIQIGPEDFDIRKLANTDKEEVQKLLKTLRKMGIKKDERKDILGSVIASAFSDVEQQNTIKTLMTIYARGSGIEEKFAGKEPTPENLLEMIKEINPTYADELISKKEKVSHASAIVLDQFKNGKGEGDRFELGGDAHRILKEIFENAPDVAKFPELSLDRPQSQALAA